MEQHERLFLFDFVIGNRDMSWAPMPFSSFLGLNRYAIVTKLMMQSAFLGWHSGT